MKSANMSVSNLVVLFLSSFSFWSVTTATTAASSVSQALTEGRQDFLLRRWRNKDDDNNGPIHMAFDTTPSSTVNVDDDDTSIFQSATEALAEASRYVQHCKSKCDKNQLQLNFCMSTCTDGSWDPSKLQKCNEKCKYNRKNQLLHSCYDDCHHKCTGKKCAAILQFKLPHHHDTNTEIKSLYDNCVKDTCRMCQSNKDCTSNVCINGVCHADLQPDGATCENGLDHCESGVCARQSLSSQATIVCCTKGIAYEDEHLDNMEQVLAPLTSDGAVTVDQGDDKKGVDEYTMNEIMEKNADDIGDDDDDDDDVDLDDDDDDDNHQPLGVVLNPLTAVCAYQPAGAACFNDELCRSRSCVNGVCACTRHKDCTYGNEFDLLCVNGKCQPNLQQDSDPCTQDSDCQSGACAHASADVASPLVCCPYISKKHTVFTYTASITDSGDTTDEVVTTDTSIMTSTALEGLQVCGAQPTGAACFENRMCSSKSCLRQGTLLGQCACISNYDCGDEGMVCLSGVCADKQDDGNPCQDNTQCVNGVCARSTLDATSPTICCPSGGAISGSTLLEDFLSRTKHSDRWTTSQKSICTDQATGASCMNYSILCKDGTTCTDGICQGLEDASPDDDVSAAENSIETTAD